MQQDKKYENVAFQFIHTLNPLFDYIFSIADSLGMQVIVVIPDILLIAIIAVIGRFMVILVLLNGPMHCNC